MLLLPREILGPLVLQFPWFNKQRFNWKNSSADGDSSCNELRICRPSVIEIRNKKWLDKRLTDLLREHNVAALRQNSATAETFPGNMLRDASVCCSFQTRSQFWRRTGALAILFTVYGGVVLLSGRDPCHHGRHAIVVAGILSLLAAVPESPAKRKPERYDLTQ
jgi:hypothetical protein